LKGLLSASFSVARCKRPMCGSARSMTSPSISSTKHSTPKAEKNSNPKNKKKLRISATITPAHIRYFFFITAVVTYHARHQDARLDGHRLVYHTPFVRIITHFHFANERKIFAEGMADETIIGEEAAQIRLAVEQDTEEVEGLALVPVGAIPDRHHGIHARRLGIQQYFHAQALVVADRQEVIHLGETRAGIRALAVTQIIDAAEVHHLIEGKGRLVAQCAHRLQQTVARYLHGGLAAIFVAAV